MKEHRLGASNTGAATHTRIPSQELNIFGGSYFIPQPELAKFYKVYCKHVFEEGNEEYLTEKQIENGPILLDSDFRYAYADDLPRQHTIEHIHELVFALYLVCLQEMCIFPDDASFPIYVFEKPNVYYMPDKSVVKDGIHMIIGLQMPHELQMLLRQKVLAMIASELCTCTIKNLPFLNNWDSILDEGISKGSTIWQVFGSRKPGNMAYQLSGIFQIGVDPLSRDFTSEVIDEAELLLPYYNEKFHKLSAQYSENYIVDFKPKCLKELTSSKRKRPAASAGGGTPKRIAVKKPPVKAAGGGGGGIGGGGIGGGGAGGGGASEEEEEEVLREEDDEIDINAIVDEISLEAAVQQFIRGLKYNEHHLHEIHQYVQILDESYYNPGSHEKNRQVAFALKHTDERLFISWVTLRSKACDFDYGSIPKLYETWSRYFNIRNRQDNLTFRSIVFWAKESSPEEFVAIKRQTINIFIEESIRDDTEYDFAYILYQLFKEKFICTSIKHKTWYMYCNHRWVKDDGESLRKAISNELYNLYNSKLDACKIELKEYADDAENPKLAALKIRFGRLMALIKKLKTTASKNNIFRETMEIFYDKDFTKNVNSNPYLMCFNNGVVDFSERNFREGYAQDYITLSTGIDYIPFAEIKDTPVYKEIIEFMQQLFPVPQLEEYMWDHLSSVLIGANINQTFNIYLGSGSNGKSLLMDLMKSVLGEYKGTVPVTLVTEKRNSIGGTSSEIAQLKGVRYAVMQEPSKDATFNEGVVKELTGGDPIQCRGLYCDSEVFVLQCTIAVCTNTLFDIKAIDDGTWRRILLTVFMSKFVDASDIDPSVPMPKYTFIKNKKLKEKFTVWAPVFASMLVERVFHTQGVVTPCEMVMAETNKYRKRQDVLSAFVSEKIIVTGDATDKVKRVELMEIYKSWYTKAYSGHPNKMPKYVELHDLMDKKFGPISKKMVWSGVQILYADEVVQGI